MPPEHDPHSDQLLYAFLIMIVLVLIAAVGTGML
jgi:hypothetical protein